MEFHNRVAFTPGSVLHRFELKTQSYSTITQTSLKALTALGITLITLESAARAQELNASTSVVQVRQAHQGSLHVGHFEQGVLHDQLVSALLAFHDVVVATQEDLPLDAREILYANLWNLYE